MFDIINSYKLTRKELEELTGDAFPSVAQVEVQVTPDYFFSLSDWTDIFCPKQSAIVDLEGEVSVAALDVPAELLAAIEGIHRQVDIWGNTDKAQRMALKLVRSAGYEAKIVHLSGGSPGEQKMAVALWKDVEPDIEMFQKVYDEGLVDASLRIITTDGEEKNEHLLGFLFEEETTPEQLVSGINYALQGV